MFRVHRNINGIGATADAAKRMNTLQGPIILSVRPRRRLSLVVHVPNVHPSDIRLFPPRRKEIPPLTILSVSKEHSQPLLAVSARNSRHLRSA